MQDEHPHQLKPNHICIANPREGTNNQSTLDAQWLVKAFQKRLSGRKNHPRSATQSSMAHIVRRAQISWLYAHPRLFLFSPHDSLSQTKGRAALAPWDPARRRQNQSSAFEWAAANKSHRASPTNIYVFVYPRRTCNRDSHTHSLAELLFYISHCVRRAIVGRTPWLMSALRSMQRWLKIKWV